MKTINIKPLQLAILTHAILMDEAHSSCAVALFTSETHAKEAMAKYYSNGTYRLAKLTYNYKTLKLQEITSL